MLDYEYHYPLSPIPSASHNIHPAFRNDPELADIMNVNESVASLVPPPRNPLRIATKPILSTVASEVVTSALSPTNSLESTSDMTCDTRTAALEPADAASSPGSPRPSTARTSISQTLRRETRKLSEDSYYDDTGTFSDRPDSQPTFSSLSSPPQRQARPISTLTAGTLSTLPCPPSLLPKEWSQFLQELQRAAALSKGQKSLAIAVALAVPIPFPAFKGLIGLGVWRYQMTENVRKGLENSSAWEKRRGRESVESVVERWNERWVERRVRVNLEVRGKGKKGRGENGKFKVVVTKLRAPKIVDDDIYESEDGN